MDAKTAALSERDTLSRRYTVAKTRDLEELLADTPGLDQWQRAIQRARTPDEMINAVCSMAGWFRQIPADPQFAAIQMLSRRIMQIRQRSGLPPFDDPLPHQDDDVRRVCLKELGQC